MHAFDAHKIVRLESPDDVFDHFIPARQSLYVERKEASARLLLTPESLDLLFLSLRMHVCTLHIWLCRRAAA